MLFVSQDYVVEPLGIMYLSSYLKQGGHRTAIVKATDHRALVAQVQPDMLCYSVTTGKHTFYRDLNMELRDIVPDALSVFGGPHPTFFPKFATEDGVDVAVRGEGFDAIVDIADALAANLPPTGIYNTVVDDIVSPLRPLKDKTTLLHPDRELIYSYPENFNNPIKNVMCSFFCPASCPYCYNARYKKMYGIHTAQIRPVDDVMAEVDELRQYPLELIFFQDDVFPVYDAGWLGSFCKAYSEQRVPFHIQVRAEMLTRGNIAQLKAVGLHGVTFAVESGNQGIRTELLGRRMSEEQITGAAELVHEAGVKLRIENMVGVPGETWATAMETLDLNIKCKPAIGWASLFQPYPGTTLGDRCREDGSFNGSLDELDGDFFSHYRLRNPFARRFERLQKLFSLVVAVPCLRWMVGFFSRLPFGYSSLYKAVKRWRYRHLYGVG